MDGQPPADTLTKEQIIAEHEAQIQAEKERKEQEWQDRQSTVKAEQERRRVQRNYNFDTGVLNIFPNYEGHSSGVRGYHFGKNFKACDGNYYAEYNANRGDNKRYYSISEQKWAEDVRLRSKYCTNCQEMFEFMQSGFPNTCPHCQAVYDDYYAAPKVQPTNP